MKNIEKDTLKAAGVTCGIITVSELAIFATTMATAGIAWKVTEFSAPRYHTQGIKVPHIASKNTDVYAPDRPLPNTPDGVHIPDTDAPHTQLGTTEGRKGKYPQGREFDEKGNPVRDIDFTDHGRPQNHPNPHQHKHKPNPTGGTPGRSKNPEPVPEWSY